MLERFKQIQDNVVKDFCQQALNAGYWIYFNKKWWTPEEFAEQYMANNLQLKDDWMNHYKIMNPRKGLAAADVMVNQILERRNQFENRILDYYVNNTK